MKKYTRWNFNVSITVLFFYIIRTYRTTEGYVLHYIQISVCILNDKHMADDFTIGYVFSRSYPNDSQSERSLFKHGS